VKISNTHPFSYDDIKLCLKKVLFLSFLFLCSNLTAQIKYDSIISGSNFKKKVVVYPYKDQLQIYSRTKPFQFVTQIPKTFQVSASMVFQKKSIPTLVVIAGTTLLLVSLDQTITDGVREVSKSIHLDPSRKYKTIISFKVGTTPINAYELPQNFNSVLYSIGEGSTSVLISGGLFLYGKVTRDYRSVSVASQIIQAQLVMGITTQFIKRISGRESPFNSTTAGGVWRPFPNPAVYQRNVSRYDAFPSGHLGTMMATAVVLIDNYPEKRWLKPVAYSLIVIVGLAMINNEVHWAGDYPLALGLGYVTAKATVKLNRALHYKGRQGRL
jgi:hypothetical protein